MSETSTTDGYITATDSMSGQTNTAHGPSHTTSSFDSVSSHFSLNKTDTLEELQQVNNLQNKRESFRTVHTEYTHFLHGVGASLSAAVEAEG
jgi:hypothetical protein